MILAPTALIEWYPAVASHYNRVPLCDAAEVHRCCIRATALAAGDPKLEPAAMFFCFADRRRAFPFAWKLMAATVAELQALANGFMLNVSAQEYDLWCVDVLYKRAGWTEIQTLLSARLQVEKT